MSKTERDIRRIGIVGAGLMGCGVAEVAAASGHETVLVKATGGDPITVRDRIAASMQRRVDRGKLDAATRERALENLTVTTDRRALIGCDLVIEAIIEDLDAKRALFGELTRLLGDDVILASNTSTLRIRDLAVPGAERRTIGLHFFSPVPAMSLVELAHVADTDPGVVAAATDFVASLGKTAVPVLDSTGFVVNRLLVPYLLGAISAYSQGLATANQIDTAMKLGCGHPVGPLALCDLIGLDVVFAMAKLLYKDFGDDSYRPPALLRRMVQDGQLGKKSRLGFFDYRGDEIRPNQAVWELVRGHGEEQHAA